LKVLSICHYRPLVCVPLSSLPPSFTTSLVPAPPSVHPSSFLRRHPLWVPPLVVRTPFPHPHPFHVNGDANRVVRTLLPLMHGPPPHPALPCLALPPALPRLAPLRPALPPFCAHARGAGGTVHHPPPFRSLAAVPSAQAAPDLTCTPSTPFARTLWAGRTEHPLSLSIRRLLPPAYALPAVHARSLHPLHKCRGRDRRDSAHLPFCLPLYPGCTRPRLHALHPLYTHTGSQADRASPSPFPFVSRPLRPGCSPLSPPAYMPPATRVPSPALARIRGKGRRYSAHPPPSVRPSARATLPGLRCATPPSTRAAPLPPPFAYPTTPARPFACIPEVQEGLGCAQGEGRAEGAMCKGATCQGRPACKGTVRKGRGHRTMGGATQAARGGDAKGVQAGRCTTWARGPACEQSGGANIRRRDSVRPQVQAKGEGV